jgi:hypothetical protein
LQLVQIPQLGHLHQLSSLKHQNLWLSLPSICRCPYSLSTCVPLSSSESEHFATDLERQAILTSTTSSILGWGASLLLFVHAGLSAYWAAGGDAMLWLLSDGVREYAHDPTGWFTAMIWGVAILKAIVAVVGIVISRTRQLHGVSIALLVVTWGAGVVLTLYGAMNLASGVGVLAGFNPADIERSTAFWAYLLLWAPLWLIIGIGYLVLSWKAMRRVQRAARATMV